MKRKGPSRRRTSSRKAGTRSGSSRSCCCTSGRSARMRTALPRRLVVDSPPALSSVWRMITPSSGRSAPSATPRAIVPRSTSSGASPAASCSPIHDPMSSLRATSACSSSRVMVTPIISVESNAARSNRSGSLSRKPMSRLIIVIGTTFATSAMKSPPPCATNRPMQSDAIASTSGSSVTMRCATRSGNTVRR